MAKGTSESQEDFNDQFVLDESGLDDLSLDDDNGLFAELDDEIRLDGGDDESAELELPDDNGTQLANGSGGGDDLGDLSDLDDLDLGGGGDDAGDALDLGGDDSFSLGDDDGALELAEVDEPLDLATEDVGDLDLSLDGGDELDLGGGGGDDLDLSSGGGDDLDLDFDDGGTPPAAAASGDAELDDLLGDGGGGDELDDLLGSEPSEDGLDDMLSGSGGDGLDDLAAGIGGDGLDDLAAGGDDEMDLNEFTEELTAESAASVETEVEDVGDELDLSMPDDELGDLELDLEGEDISLAADDAGDGAGDEEEEFNPDDLGEEELEFLPMDEEVMEAAPDDDALEMDALDELELDTLEVPEEPDFSMDAGVTGMEEGGQFVAAPDLDTVELEDQLDALDASKVESGEEESEVEDVPAPPAVEPASADEDDEFTAVADVNLEDDSVLDLSLGAINGGETYSNIQSTAQEDVLEVPLHPQHDPTGRAVTAASGEAKPSIDTQLLLSIPHHVNVEMGSITLKGQDLLDLSYGSVLPMDRTVGEPVDLVLEGRAIAQGEIVLINGKNLGIRIVSVTR